MEKDKFAAILPIVIGGLVNEIISEMHIKDDEAFDKLYGSELYAAMENEETKLWTYSVPKLFEIFKNEINTGELDLPDY